MDLWEALYREAKRVQNDRVISPFIEAGGVAAARLTKAGNIHTLIGRTICWFQALGRLTMN